ncbi:hypothetical protein ACTXT7_012878 [Hymenolepis weldensis]
MKTLHLQASSYIGGVVTQPTRSPGGKTKIRESGFIKCHEDNQVIFCAADNVFRDYVFDEEKLYLIVRSSTTKNTELTDHLKITYERKSIT